MSNNAISTIEVQARKLVRPEGGEASVSQEQIINDDNEASGSATGSHGQLIEQSEMLSIVIDDKSKTSRSLQERLNSLKWEAQKNNLTPKIQKVPFILRENKDFEKYYEPRVVAVGPIHHGHPKFEYAENAKRRLADGFLKENGIDAENLYNKIMAELQDLKNSYVEDVIKSYSDDELAWMFLVDGCAILHFIYCVVWKPGQLEKLQIKKDQVAFAQQDLFLLENQLPFQLLQLLMTFILDNKKKEDINESISKFIHSNIMTTDQQMATLSKSAYHLLDLLRKQLLICTPTPKEYKTPHSFRNVTELIAAGIRLKPTGKSCLEISFGNRCFIGTLKLPSLVVDDSTAPKFLNLIAYEMCPDFMNNFDVTSYICFLDSLIDQPEDVQELRKAHILTNVLGSDKEVAKLFNKIGTDLVPNPELYAQVKDDIETHYNSRYISWMAQAYHSYFSSPWTFLALLGALFALFLSSVQAYYSWRPRKQP